MGEQSVRGDDGGCSSLVGAANSSVPDPDAATTTGAGVTVNPAEEYETMNLDHFLQSVGFEAD